MKPVTTILVLIICCVSPFILNAGETVPELERTAFIDNIDERHVLCQTSLPNNNLVVATLSHPSGNFRPFGDVTLFGVEADFTVRWELMLNGPMFVSDVESDASYVYITGEAGGAVQLGSHALDSGDTFLAWLSHDGDILNAQTIDETQGRYARLHLTDNETLLFSAFDDNITFGGTVLMELTLSGEVIRSRSIPSISVSDMTTLPNGKIGLAGMFLRSDTLDGIVVQPPFGYVNFAALFSGDFTAEWIYVSEHVTFESQHQIDVLGDNIVFSSPERADVSTLNPMITMFDMHGNIVKSVIAKTKKHFQLVQMEVLGDYLVVASDYHNYSNPIIADTADITIYDSELDQLSTHTLIGEIQSIQSIIMPFTMSANKNSVEITWVADSAHFNIDDFDVDAKGNNQQFLLVTQVELPVSTDVAGDKDSHSLVYPNPASSGVEVVLSNGMFEGHMYEIVSVSGIVHSSGNVQSHGRIQLPQLASGRYSIIIDGIAHPIVVR